MSFTDLFVRRPVLASVVSLLILVLGARSLMSLELRQYPELTNTVVTVTTPYPGASSELVKGFITTPLQQAIAEADGIDYLMSSSRQGASTIEAYMQLGYDPRAAVAEIQAKVASQRNVLPEAAEDPVIDSQTGDEIALMYIVFYSETMTPSQVNDYLLRVARPRLQAVPGVAKAEVFGRQKFAMRVWLDPTRMAALGVTAADVRDALRRNNFLAGAGETKGDYVTVDLAATTDLTRPGDFAELVVRNDGDTLVRLRDVAELNLGSEDYESASLYNGKPGTFIGIDPAPGSNPLAVAKRIHVALEELKAQSPAGLDIYVPYDASEFIEDSINEVFKTLGEAVAIVLVVIVLCLGSLRAALVPAVAVPLSLIGGAFLMLLMGFSINLLTLLAMVLSIGLVVDDAIVVVENVHRHIEDGLSAFDAALVGARELLLPLIAMTTTLVAVYAPIGFMGGLVGTLFTEFAFTLAGAVLISGIVALTLSPMLCSKVFRQRRHSWFERLVERSFGLVSAVYARALSRVLDFKSVVAVFGLCIFVAIYWMFALSQQELAPNEDQSILYTFSRGPESANIDYTKEHSAAILELFESIPEYQDGFFMMGWGGGPNSVFAGFKLVPQSERERSQSEVQPDIQFGLMQLPAFEASAFPRPALPGSGRGLPLQFVLTSPEDYSELDRVADDVLGRAMASGQYMFLRKSINFTRPKTTIVIDRERAGVLGIGMDEIAGNLVTLLGGSHVNWFNLEGRSYKVIPQVARSYRETAAMLDEYYIRAGNGDLVPLSTLVRFEHSVEPSDRTQFQQLNSIIVEGLPAPTVSMGSALANLEDIAREVLPRGFSFDYAGQSRQYTSQGGALMVTFAVSLLVIYLVLAAQFESWRDPLIILMSVPMSIAGALAFVAWGFASVNIYTQVGAITLIGVIAKNGILLVEFANVLQEKRGFNQRDAIVEAARIRLRPILMTTVALIVAMVPLLVATGPGAVSRFHIGLVIATGLGIGTLFTLFVVPTAYLLIGKPRETAAGGSAEVPSGDPAPA